ncbi:hypothetical protein CC1G_04902 [Coprinopsis cinerea okayama7|uniref:Uncharacterized protein n=1 Tax=Coprinopsis cinerea (strain Okayama-7 / 130 / ATCC MYA-4618 / FGSC 9003) TaxID=240176 RepID=A8PFG5_COPC7|nr:hypothetical protein CC1G_04902 [Coprinopsis cinerea okayama7\|eukprot:XP_001841058.2 hypothetical protein CC1G_04902 [Coprinopsis cinerea okayama7\
MYATTRFLLKWIIHQHCSCDYHHLSATTLSLYDLCARHYHTYRFHSFARSDYHTLCGRRAWI